MNIINKIKIFSALILTVCSAAACLSACTEDKVEIIPDETVIGTQGEILGVSYYTVENETETHSVIFEITTKKEKNTKSDKKIFGNKTTDKSEESNSDSVVNSENTVISKNNSSVNEDNLTETYKSETKIITKKSDIKTTKPKHVPVSYKKKTENKTEKQQNKTTVRATKQETKKHNANFSAETVPEIIEGLNIVFKSDTVSKGDDASLMIQGVPGKKYILEFYPTSGDSVFTESDEQISDKNGFVSWTFRIPMNCENGNRKIIIKEIDSSNYIQTSIKIK